MAQQAPDLPCDVIMIDVPFPAIGSLVLPATDGTEAALPGDHAVVIVLRQAI
jgi:hypothetical protein